MKNTFWFPDVFGGHHWACFLIPVLTSPSSRSFFPDFFHLQDCDFFSGKTPVPLFLSSSFLFCHFILFIFIIVFVVLFPYIHFNPTSVFFLSFFALVGVPPCACS